MGQWSYVLIFLVALLESTAFVGLLVPGTTFAIFTGFLASQKIIDVGDVIWIMTLGGVAGDALSYYFGTRGKAWFNKTNRFFKQSYLDRGKIFFERHGEKSVMLARFIGPFRPVVPFIAGAVRMPKLKFFGYNIIGGLLAAMFYTLTGYFFGEAWKSVANILGRFGVGAVVLVLGILIFGYIFDTYILKKTK